MLTLKRFQFFCNYKLQRPIIKISRKFVPKSYNRTKPGMKTKDSTIMSNQLLRRRYWGMKACILTLLSSNHICFRSPKKTKHQFLFCYISPPQYIYAYFVMVWLVFKCMPLVYYGAHKFTANTLRKKTFTLLKNILLFFFFSHKLVTKINQNVALKKSRSIHLSLYFDTSINKQNLSALFTLFSLQE